MINILLLCYSDLNLNMLLHLKILKQIFLWLPKFKFGHYKICQNYILYSLNITKITNWTFWTFCWCKIHQNSKFWPKDLSKQQNLTIDHLVLGHCSSTTKQVVVVICVLPPYYFAWPQNENRKAASASSLSLYFEAV